MLSVRSLDELPAVIANMRATAGKLPESSITKIADGVRDEVARQGGRYYVRGRGGAKVRLGARVQRSRVGKAYTASRSVSGEPAGFWRIINDGSGAHLIAGRYRSNGRRRSARAASSQFGRNADSFNGSPINIPGIGWRQYAVHPGHGSVGQPWRKAMAQSDRIVGKTLETESAKALIRAWNK
jgi:hypothetical protein